MDSYEVTRIVFSRIQSIDPENASKIMGFLLIQDHGEKEMFHLAFGPETLIHALIVRAYNDLGLSPTATPTSPSLFHSLSRQNSASRIPSPAWAPPLSSSNFSGLDNLISPNSSSAASYASVVATNGNGFNHNGNNTELVDELHLQDQLSFLNDAPKNQDLFYPSSELGTSPNNSTSESMLFHNWGMNNGQHRRSLSVTDIGLGSDPFGWKPCHYFARGYCKNGTSCRYLHAPPDSPDSTTMVGSPGELDAMEQCQEFLLRSKSRHQTQRLSSASQLLASGSFPYSPRHSEKCLNFMLQQQQQNDTQRAAAAAAAAGLMLGGEDLHQFGRSIMDRNDFSSITGVGMVNLGSRQIYLTFSTGSTFREENVSTYFRKQQLMEREEFSPSTSPSGHDHRDPYDLQLSMQMQGNPRMMYSTHDLLRRKMEEQAEL